MFEQDKFTENFEIVTDSLTVEEVLIDDDVSNFHEAIEIDSAKGFGLKVLRVCVLLGLGIIAFQLFSLQLYQGTDFLLAAEGNRIRTIQKFAPRGLILDRYGDVIARNVPSFELTAVPKDLPEDEARYNALLTVLSETIGLKVDEINSLISAADKNLIEPLLIKQNLSQEEALRLEETARTFNGIQIQSSPIREYLDGPAFSNLVGYVGKLTLDEWGKHKDEGYFFNDTIGKIGIESVYEKSLRGVHGGRLMEVDAGGSVVKRLKDVDPEPGHDLSLTIDAGLQKVIYNSLTDMLRTRPSATGAAAVAVNPRTGEILSLVSLPSFDNNLFARGIKPGEYNHLINDKNKPLLNRPLGGTYPPGSTIKPVIGAAALEEGVITEKTKIKDEGVVRLGAYSFYGWDRDGLGVMDIISAIAQSSDPFFYIVGGGNDSYNIEGLGIDRLVKYFRAFGLGEKTNINLAGEEPGFVPTPEWKKQRFAGTDEQNWYQGNTYHISIGQGFLLATPLQVAMYTAGIANDGIIMRPVISSLEQKEILHKVNIDQKNLDIIKRAMRENVVSGSGRRLAALPIEAAGKTGTSQFSAAEPSRTHAWYTGFAPYNDPQIVITVLVESGGEGHSTAAPVVEDALEWWAANR